MTLPAGVETAADLLARSGTHTALPVCAPLAGVLPLGGLERGRVHGITGDAAVSLVYALVAEATEHGAWCAFVDMPHAGLRAAHEHGVALQRVVCIDTDRSSSWARAVGALVEGIDIVVVRDPVCTPAEARKVASRVKAQGAVLLVHGRPGPFPVDMHLSVRTQSWCFGACATDRTVGITVEGRRVPGRRTATVLLPSVSGRAATV